MIENIYDLVFVGAGPSTIFALLKLIKLNYKGSILIFEKGKSLKKRLPNEIINGWAGAGAFSDSKLSSALEVGGNIPTLTQDKLIEYETEILDTLNEFKIQTLNKELLKWDNTKKYNTKNSGLSWDIHKTCHIGTDVGKLIYEKIEEFICNQSNIEIKFETEVEDIIKNNNNYYDIKLKGNYSFKSKNVVIATGQKDKLPSKIINNFNLKSNIRAFQIGIRVEDIMNNDYKKLIEANYDFKLVDKYNINNVLIRVRTFCCNSGNAYICEEKTNEGFICFNGHALKKSNPSNNTVNYGIICEVTGLEKYNTKEEQINLMKKINEISTWKVDNYVCGEVKSHKKLLNGFKNLEGYYPKEILIAMSDYINNLSKIVDLSKATYVYPEVKLSGEYPDINYNSFETKEKGLYMIGDCICSRGLVKSFISGMMFASNFINYID